MKGMVLLSLEECQEGTNGPKLNSLCGCRSSGLLLLMKPGARCAANEEEESGQRPAPPHPPVVFVYLLSSPSS